MEACKDGRHEWSEEVEACRKCGSLDVEEVEPTFPNQSNAAGLRVVSEPVLAMWCSACDDYVMVSPALQCERCGAVEWAKDMDDEIFGA